MIRTTCPSCGAGCGLKVFLKDGKVIEIYGDEENQLNKGSLCSQGLYALFYLYHKKRLLRQGDLGQNVLTSLSKLQKHRYEKIYLPRGYFWYN